jgi:hypothetical protein
VDPPTADGGGGELVGANEAPDSGAGALSAPDLGGGVAANSEPPDAGVAPAVGESLTPHEREEAAKDAVDDAREAIAAGDVVAARAALTAAQQLDPGNSDIARLRAQLARLSAANPAPPPPGQTP